MTTPVTLDDWLSSIYQADIRGQRSAKIADFKAALTANETLRGAAQKRQEEINSMIAARGELACSFSAKYRNFLQEALTA